MASEGFAVGARGLAGRRQESGSCVLSGPKSAANVFPRGRKHSQVLFVLG